MKGASFDLTGRIALITGSSRGIGLAFAEGLAAAGAEVVINSNEPEEMEAARRSLVAEGARAHAMGFDVTDMAAMEDAVERIELEIGAIDILVANAGIQRRAPFVDFEAETYRAVMATNLDHIFFIGQIVARRMIPRGRGKIINTCSLNSEIGRQTIVPYTASKGAVKMLTKGMCVELAKYGIQVNGIGPGYMKTELNRALVEDDDFSAWVAARTPAGRWGELDELKSTIVFLASESSSFINGQVICVDGGFTSSM
jgi:gluconate 5-dehydrogenase